MHVRKFACTHTHTTPCLSGLPLTRYKTIHNVEVRASEPLGVLFPPLRGLALGDPTQTGFSLTPAPLREALLRPSLPSTIYLLFYLQPTRSNSDCLAPEPTNLLLSTFYLLPTNLLPSTFYLLPTWSNSDCLTPEPTNLLPSCDTCIQTPGKVKKSLCDKC